MNSFVEENYLKALFLLSNEKGEVNVNELSKNLNLKMPTITSMMKKLAAKQLVHYESYKPLRLTEEGRREAALIIRRHRLTEMFLVEKMGFGWEEVHEIAEQVEHIKSPYFFEKMDELLHYPVVDPHGSPIPDRHGKIPQENYTKLSECRVGERVRLVAVINAADDFLRFLNQRAIKLGLSMVVERIEPFDRTMVISYNQRSETLSQLVCERLLIEKKQLSRR